MHEINHDLKMGPIFGKLGLHHRCYDAQINQSGNIHKYSLLVKYYKIEELVLMKLLG